LSFVDVRLYVFEIVRVKPFADWSVGLGRVQFVMGELA
jgi:hypothetical protein